MKVFTISDLHLSTTVEKPMDIFGDNWANHFEKISKDWKSKVTDEDLVLLGGDISWGLTIDEARADYELIDELPGKKFVLRGNHDYYWNSLSKMRTNFPNFNFIQNNAYKEENVIICGSRGWNIPVEDTSDHDRHIYKRELERLELSLNAAEAKRESGDIVIAVLHYPPFLATYEDSEVTQILEKHNVDIALYGHLHGKNVRVTPKLEKNGVVYYLTSCDLIDNKLIYLL